MPTSVLQPYVASIPRENFPMLGEAVSFSLQFPYDFAIGVEVDTGRPISYRELYIYIENYRHRFSCLSQGEEFLILLAKQKYFFKQLQI